jgi:hypothetical protein
MIYRYGICIYTGTTNLCGQRHPYSDKHKLVENSMSCVFICNDNWHAKNNFKKYILGCRGKNQTRDKKKQKQNKIK